MRIGSDHQKHALRESADEHVTLEVTGPDQHNGEDASSVVVVGCGYESTDGAREAGLSWAGILQRAFACLNIGADLGGRRKSDGWTSRLRETQAADNEDQQQAAEILAGMKLLYDQPGLMLFEDDPWPTFARRTSFGWAGQSPSILVDAVAAVRRAAAPLSPMEQTAYELYSSSFSAVSSDARFVVLMMALETLIEPQPRDAAVVAHVNALIEQTRRSDLPENEVTSLMGSLEYMRRESIRQAGRRLVRVLGSRQYMNLAADKFFTTCYTLRSRLVHGEHPRPSREEIDSHTPGLERLVSDLLAGNLRDDSVPSR